MPAIFEVRSDGMPDHGRVNLGLEARFLAYDIEHSPAAEVGAFRADKPLGNVRCGYLIASAKG